MPSDARRERHAERVPELACAREAIFEAHGQRALEHPLDVVAHVRPEACARVGRDVGVARLRGQSARRASP